MPPTPPRDPLPAAKVRLVVDRERAGSLRECLIEVNGEPVARLGLTRVRHDVSCVDETTWQITVPDLYVEFEALGSPPLPGRSLAQVWEGLPGFYPRGGGE